MKKQSLTTSQERKMKFAEAGILIGLVLALAIFVGTRLTSPDSEQAAVSASDSVATQVEFVSDLDPAQLSQEPAAVITEVAEVEPQIVVHEEATPAKTIQEESEPVTYAAAEKKYFSGDFAAAAAMFSRYTTEHEGNAWGHYMLGLAEWKAGDPQAAEDAFLQALGLKPDHLKSLVNYGRVLIQMDRNEEALTQIELALAINPNSLEATRVQGRVQHNLGLLDQAVASYRTVLATMSEDAWALNNLGLVLIQQEKFADALPPLAKASLLHPDAACIQNNLGIVLERTGHFIAAGEAYTRALTADESYVKAADSLARVEGLTEAVDLEPVDLAAVAAGFNNGSLEDDMEVASTITSSTPEIDEPETDGSRNR